MGGVIELVDNPTDKGLQSKKDIREEGLTEYRPPPMAGPTIIPTPVKSSR